MLTQSSFIPTSDAAHMSTGDWISSENGATVTSLAIKQIVREITRDPSHTFGLTIGKGANFSTNTPSGGSTSIASNAECRTAIYSTPFFESTHGYATTTVSGNDNVVPTLNVYLTYDPRFSTTLMGDITFTLREFNSSNVEVGTVDVTISISTILTEFKDQTYELVAMKNGFDNHVYSRKLILPASMRRRSLYLSDIEWEPLSVQGSLDTNGTAFNFGFTTVENAVNSRASLGETTFALSVQPTEDLSNTLTTTLGWYRMDVDNLDIRTQSAVSGDSRQPYSVDPADGTTGRKIHYNDNDGKGLQIGVLDGRSSAGFDMSLYSNGDQE